MPLRLINSVVVLQLFAAS